LDSPKLDGEECLWSKKLEASNCYSIFVLINYILLIY
jgi:hypothetical protein